MLKRDCKDFLVYFVCISHGISVLIFIRLAVQSVVFTKAVFAL